MPLLNPDLSEVQDYVNIEAEQMFRPGQLPLCSRTGDMAEMYPDMEAIKQNTSKKAERWINFLDMMM